jgi:hypothetical protein
MVNMSEEWRNSIIGWLLQNTNINFITTPNLPK